MRSITLLFISFKNRLTDGTLCFAGAKDHDGFTLGIEYALDEAIRGIDFHSIRTPTKVAAGIRVAPAN